MISGGHRVRLSGPNAGPVLVGIPGDAGGRLLRPAAERCAAPPVPQRSTAVLLIAAPHAPQRSTAVLLIAAPLAPQRSTAVLLTRIGAYIVKRSVDLFAYLDTCNPVYMLSCLSGLYKGSLGFSSPFIYRPMF